MSDRCILIGAPVEAGTGRRGADMGARAFRAAGLAETLRDLGLEVREHGNLFIGPVVPKAHPNPMIGDIAEIAAWTEVIEKVAYETAAQGMPIFLGGDHSVAAGSIAGINRRAVEDGRELFVLWLDAHSDYHTLDTTESGNLHGVPAAYVTGRPGFAGYFPPLVAPVKPENVCMVGLRSVDPAERSALDGSGITVHDMRAIDENGIGRLVGSFLKEVVVRGGILHVSLDVDFLDPEIAPGVGTTVPGGATFREAHLVMEMLHDTGLVRSLDVVELNPFLDERGRTALLLVDLVASLMGRRILDRPTRSWS
ncbi:MULTISPECIES: arginase [Xanthobacteraceae]|uniref:Arginase n=1 Tax=Labrys monachus TaxID=217067 RepID=A0ABU0FFY1_9HYPH|nr:MULTISPECIES: arginase [Xanthobacteraceae]MBS7538220.1 arginase [Ancylobacter lacus]MDQ0393522.1 arginase [Labrys monachus]